MARARRHREVKVLPAAGYKRGRKETGHTFVPELQQVLKSRRNLDLLKREDGPDSRPADSQQGSSGAEGLTVELPV